MQHRKGIKNMVSLSTEPTDDEGVTGTGGAIKLKSGLLLGACSYKAGTDERGNDRSSLPAKRREQERRNNELGARVGAWGRGGGGVSRVGNEPPGVSERFWDVPQRS